MRVLIIEDETIAAQRLEMLLHEYDASLEILDCLDSIEDTLSWLQHNEHPDLMMLDIHLADGYCFEIFKRTSYNKPVIFTTAYNEYALDAFRYFSIDYLLKPISFEALKKAIDKYKLITNTAQADYSQIFNALKKLPLEQYKERFLARVGQRLIFIKTSEIAYFRAEDKVVYIIDKLGNKLPVDYTLDKLETMLDPRYFFRLNRKVIVSIDSIAQVKPYYNNRLMLSLKDGHKCDDMIISRERVPEFRHWADQ